MGEGDRLVAPLLAAALLLCPGGAGLAAQEATAVRTAPVRTEHVDYVVRTYGVLAPKVEEISFRIDGRIDAFLADAGDRVRAGDPLVRLDTRDRADFLRTRQLEFESAERELERMRTLFAKGSVQRAMLDDARSAHDVLEIEVALAREALVRSEVRAPTDGMILDQYVDSRTNVGPGQPIYLFQYGAKPWFTEVDLTDRHALHIGVGARAEIRLAPWPGRVFTGRVSKLARVADPASGLFTAEVTIDPDGAALLPGMVAEVDLRQASELPFSVLPFEALLEVRGDDGLAYFLEAGSEIARERSLTIHSVDGDRVAVEEDLGAFEAVVVRGQQRLRDGSPVRSRR